MQLLHKCSLIRKLSGGMLLPSWMLSSSHSSLPPPLLTLRFLSLHLKGTDVYYHETCWIVYLNALSIKSVLILIKFIAKKDENLLESHRISVARKDHCGRCRILTWDLTQPICNHISSPMSHHASTHLLYLAATSSATSWLQLQI